MSTDCAWFLPEGIEEVVGLRAAMLDRLCRQLLDLYASWGYELVIPPLIEYLDSLLAGASEDLNLQTFKIIDQLSGRMMGIRADTTPQVARIDARVLRRDTPSRLCYLGSVLHTRPQDVGGSRIPLQIGAELYGHAGVESDVEIVCLLVQTLQIAGVKTIHLDLGHIGIFRSLIAEFGLSTRVAEEVFSAIQHKCCDTLLAVLNANNVDVSQQSTLLQLVNLHGGEDVLEQAENGIAKERSYLHDYLRELRALAKGVSLRYGENLVLHYDLAELRGYNYHTGVVFSAYCAGYGEGIACGGRYDGIGAVFGRTRPATGFSVDVKTLLNFCSETELPSVDSIFAPPLEDSDLISKISVLRAEGKTVVMGLPGQQGGAKEMMCNRQLQKIDKKWCVIDV